jgi:hypothetical protein
VERGRRCLILQKQRLGFVDDNHRLPVGALGEAFKPLFPGNKWLLSLMNDRKRVFLDLIMATPI